MNLLFSGLPKLNQFNSKLTSAQTPRYNCVAWSVCNDLVSLWPDDDNRWPVGFSRTETLEAFLELFVSIGFLQCADGNLEPGFMKIALFVNLEGVPSHVARQLGSGQWTSKLGILADIEHRELSLIEGDDYGRVAVYMRRSNASGPIQLPRLHPPPPLIIQP